MTGAGPLAVEGPDGPTWNVAAPLTIPDGTTTTVVVRFQMPGHHGSMTVVPSARIPAEQWTANGRTFDDTAPTTITLVTGHGQRSFGVVLRKWPRWAR